MSAMTVGDVPSAMPHGDANAGAPESGDSSLISAGARGHDTTGPDDGTLTVTERAHTLRAARARRVAEAPTPKEAAAAQWGSIRDEIGLFASEGLDVPRAWAIADQWLRDLREAVAAEVTIRVAEVELRRQIRVIGNGVYPTYEERVIQRRENRNRHWGNVYAEHGGSPDRDAPLSWSRIGAEVAKLRKHELDEDDLWRRIGDRLRDLHAEVQALLDEEATS